MSVSRYDLDIRLNCQAHSVSDTSAQQILGFVALVSTLVRPAFGTMQICRDLFNKCVDLQGSCGPTLGGPLAPPTQLQTECSHQGAELINNK